jgi:hypothetical protein
MAEITASMVKELREKTDAPMMECKKALSEAAGDMAKAEEILRVKLGNKASKAAARVTAEGIVGVYISADAKLGAMVEVNCETDFVAKNDDFLASSRTSPNWSPPRTRPTSRRCPPSRSTVRPLKKSARRWSARSARTCRSAASSAPKPRAPLPATSTAAPRSAC